MNCVAFGLPLFGLLKEIKSQTLDAADAARDDV